MTAGTQSALWPAGQNRGTSQPLFPSSRGQGILQAARGGTDGVSYRNPLSVPLSHGGGPVRDKLILSRLVPLVPPLYLPKGYMKSGTEYNLTVKNLVPHSFCY